MWRGYQTLAGKLSTPWKTRCGTSCGWRSSCLLWQRQWLSRWSYRRNQRIKGGVSGGENIWQMLDNLWKSARVLEKLYMTWIILLMLKMRVGQPILCLAWHIYFNAYYSFCFDIAEVMILLLSITAPIFIFCLCMVFCARCSTTGYKIFLQRFNHTIFSFISSYCYQFFNVEMAEATAQAGKANIVELGAQVVLLVSAPQYWCISPLK